jgi:CubicO group peptidase (beta-lactamase class C family)
LVAQDIYKAKLDSLFDILSANHQAMGSIAIAKEGKLIYERAIGYRVISASGQIPANSMTRYRIGSISKLFTATMIFQLVEDNKISLEETLDKYFPVIPNADRITISNLLNHRSGIHNFTNDPAYMTYNEMPKTQEEMIEIMAAGGSDFDPDTKAEYSNSNFVILGYILEKISGKSYAENLDKRITSKLELANTYVGQKTDPDQHEAFSYTLMGQWNQYSETDMSIPGGAGAIVSTPGDLVKFIHGLFAGKLIAKESLEQMKTLKDNYGMGIFQIPFYERSGYGHNGSIDAFTASLGYFPEDKIAIAYCTNGQVYPMNEIIVGALSAVFDKPYMIPSFTTITLSEEALDQYIGVYASPTLPVKLTVTRQEGSLFAQATGQMPFPLEATAMDKFKFDAAGIMIEFDRENNTLTLKQGGGEFTFSRE